MWEEFKNKITVKEDLLCGDGCKFPDWSGNIRRFNVVISKKMSEYDLDAEPYDSNLIWCTTDKDYDIKDWFKKLHEVEYEVDISRECYKRKGTEIANFYAKNMKTQLFFTIESVMENEVGLRPIYYKHKMTKLYK